MTELGACTLRSAAELAALEPEWWDLWRRMPRATPFQSPAWLLPWWDAFSPGTLAAVAVRRDGRLAALAPLYVERGSRRCRLLPLGMSVSDYLDVLIDPRVAGLARDSLLRQLAGEPGWDQWELPDLAADAAALSLGCPPRWQVATERSSLCSTLRLPGAGGTDPLPRAVRRKLRMAHNRADRRGGLGFVHADRGSVHRLVAELIRLHGAAWQARGEAGVLADGRFRAFLHAAAPRLHEAGLLRLYGLKIGGRMVAIFFGFHHRHRSFAYLTGFDPDYARESPGSILLAHAIEEAVREGAEEIDFLRGGEAYKSRWGAAPRVSLRRVFRREAAHVDAA